MGFFSKSKDEKELALVFDIGSSSVGGALFEIQKLGNPRIVLSIREPIVLEKKIDIDRFLNLTLKSLEIVASKICQAGWGKPSKIFCVLSSPWYASQTRVIRLEKNTPFLFTSKLAEDLIKKEISLFEEEHLAKFSETGNKIRLLEFKNMKMMLNGYPTSEPYDKKAKKLEMVIFMSMSSEQILKKIEEAVLRHFNSQDIKFTSFVMSAFTVARDMFISQEDFLLVDIGGEVTDISMIKKDILSDSISFPLGYNFMIRKTASWLNCTLSDAKSLLSLYKDDHAAPSTFKKLEPLMNKHETEWLKKFQESLATLSEDISIPSNIFITVDKDLADFFLKIIKTEQFNQYNLTESEFKIVFLDSEILHGIASFGEDVSRDSFLTIESVYLNRFIC